MQALPCTGAPAAAQPETQCAPPSQLATPPGSTPEAPKRGIGAVIQEQSTAAAAGWQNMYGADEEQEGGAEAEVEVDAEAEAAFSTACVPAGQPSTLGPDLVADGEGCLPIYFLDAYENTEARPGEWADVSGGRAAGGVGR